MNILITEEQLRKITESHNEYSDDYKYSDNPEKNAILIDTLRQSAIKARKKTKIIYDSFRTGIINAYGVKLRYILPEDDDSVKIQSYLVTIKGLPKFRKIEEDGTETPYPVGDFRLLDLIRKIEERFLKFKVHLKVD
jgi:hypothetical protein